MSELHYGIWRFEDSSLDKVLIVTISYGDLSIDELWGDTIRRPIMPTDRLMTYQEFMLSMKIFLQQFATLSSRWGRMYEPITEQIIMDAATFQLFWFTRANLIPTDLLDESTLIAAALYCLVLTNDMSQVTGNWRWRLTLSNPAITYEHMADVEKDPNKGTSPAVDIWKFSGREAQPLKAGPPHKRTFASVLRVILQSAQRILYRGRAEDEPYLFYILCILFLVCKDIKDCADWTGAMDEGAEVLEDSLREFCHMFHLSSGNIHPLSPDFDDEAYASMADGNGFAAEHYRELHQLWEDNSMCSPVKKKENANMICRVWRRNGRRCRGPVAQPRYFRYGHDLLMMHIIRFGRLFRITIHVPTQLPLYHHEGWNPDTARHFQKDIVRRCMLASGMRSSRETIAILKLGQQT